MNDHPVQLTPPVESFDHMRGADNEAGLTQWRSHHLSRPQFLGTCRERKPGRAQFGLGMACQQHPPGSRPHGALLGTTIPRQVRYGDAELPRLILARVARKSSAEHAPDIWQCWWQCWRPAAHGWIGARSLAARHVRGILYAALAKWPPNSCVWNRVGHCRLRSAIGGAVLQDTRVQFRRQCAATDSERPRLSRGCIVQEFGALGGHQIVVGRERVHPDDVEKLLHIHMLIG